MGFPTGKLQDAVQLLAATVALCRKEQDHAGARGQGHRHALQLQLGVEAALCWCAGQHAWVFCMPATLAFRCRCRTQAPARNSIVLYAEGGDDAAHAGLCNWPASFCALHALHHMPLLAMLLPGWMLLQELATLARRKGVCLHVDACLGGFYLPFARMLGADIPAFDFSVPGVTSMSVDTHK